MVLGENPFTIERYFEAPQQDLWHALSDPEALAKWWGPKGFELTVESFDFRPGGLFLYRMSTPNNVMWGRFIYSAIEAPDRLTYVSSFSDPEGGITRAPFGIPFPLQVLNVLDLEPVDQGTRLTLRGGPVDASPEEIETFANMHDSMRGGFGGTLDQLDEYLKTMR